MMSGRLICGRRALIGKAARPSSKPAVIVRRAGVPVIDSTSAMARGSSGTYDSARSSRRRLATVSPACASAAADAVSAAQRASVVRARNALGLAIQIDGLSCKRGGVVVAPVDVCP